MEEIGSVSPATSIPNAAFDAVLAVADPTIRATDRNLILKPTISYPTAPA
jgi:hypothetical protein